MACRRRSGAKEIQRAVEEYAVKLRSLSDVKVYLGPASPPGRGAAPSTVERG